MKRRAWITLAVVALLGAAGVVWYYEIEGDAPREMVELVAEGGEKVLRDPMRPARGGSRVLVFALDGVGEGALRAAVSTGRMPRVAALLGRPQADRSTWEHAWMQPGVLSVLPSTTFAAWASLFTGQPPAYTGVPGNEWFAREERRFYAPAPVTMTEHEHALKVFTDQYMGQVLRVPTVYERAGVRSYVSLQAFHRGADLLTMPEPRAYTRLITEAAEGLVDDETPGQEVYEELDVTAVESLLKSVGSRSVADLQVIYFPGVDLYTHVARDPLADQLRYLAEVVDARVGEVLEAYRGAGALDSTWVMFVADHGHTPVLADDRHSLGAEGADEPPQVLRNAGFRVRALRLNPHPDEEDYQATVAYQGAFAYVYLADRSTCAEQGTRCDWKRPPRLREDVLPIVRAFDAANRTGEGVPGLRGTLDLVFARQPRAPGQDALPFQVWDGTRLVPIREYLAAHPRPELLDLERRLHGLAAGPYGHRAGDVLLLARTGMHRPVADRYYFSGHYQSWHGSPTAQDSEIPLLVARANTSGDSIRDRVRRAVGPNPSQLSITPLILDLLGSGGGH
jgi:hypothetical protein